MKSDENIFVALKLNEIGLIGDLLFLHCETMVKLYGDVDKIAIELQHKIANTYNNYNKIVED